MWEYNHSDELCHYGVLGMKWGRRKNRYKQSSTKKPKRQLSQDAKEAREIKKKKISEMSNAELKKINERQTLERNYKTANPSAIKKGLTIATTTAATMGTVIAIKNNGKQIVDMGKGIVDRLKDIKM